MLGGSVWIAVIRFVISFAGVIILFLSISESRFDRKKQYSTIPVLAR